MEKQVNNDLGILRTGLADAGLEVAILRYGSAANGFVEGHGDVDVALIVRADQKTELVSRLRQLGACSGRSMNWSIDVFNSSDPTYGYNGSPSRGLHLLIMSQEEYEGDSSPAISVRTAQTSNARRR